MASQDILWSQDIIKKNNRDITEAQHILLSEDKLEKEKNHRETAAFLHTVQ